MLPRFVHRWVPALLFVAALLLTGCPKNLPLTSDAATTALSKYWFDEENQIYGVCNAISLQRAGEPSEKAALDAVFSPQSGAAAATRVSQELRAEVVEGLGSIFKTLAVEAGACVPQTILQGALLGSPVGEPCLTKLDAALKGSLDEPGTKVRAALRRAGFDDAKSILQNPIRAARLLDFSPAVVSAFVGLAKHAETTLDNILEDVKYPVVGAVARSVARELAAEAIAAGLDVFLDKLESENLVRAPALARRACELYPSAQQHAGLVTVRGLKRIILRFDLGASPSHAPHLACKTEVVPAKLCEEIQHKSTKDDAAPAVPPPPRFATAFRPATDKTIADVHARLAVATKFCSLPTEDGASKKETRVECTFDYLGAVVSVLQTYRLESTASAALVRERMLEVTDRLSELGSSLIAVRSDLEDVKGAVAGAAAADYAEAARSEALHKKTLSLLLALTNCRDEYDQVISARIAQAKKLGLSHAGGVLPANVCTTLPAEATFGKQLGSTRVETTQASVCDVFSPLQLTIATDNAFAECAPAPDEATSGAVKELAQLMCEGAPADSEPHIVLVGHTDQQPLGDACKKATGFTSNLPLSIARSNGIALSVMAGFGTRCRTGKIEVLGWGEARPVRPDCRAEDKACHALNRRVTIELVDGLGSTMRLEKCAITPPAASPGAKGAGKK